MSVCQNIKAVAEAREINIKELSRRVDIPYTTLYNMLNRDSDRFDLNLLENIARSLNVSVETLMSSTVPSIEQIKYDYYPSYNNSTHCPSDDESTNLRNNEDDKPCKAERTDRFPFKPADKRYRALCDFDTLIPSKSTYTSSEKIRLSTSLNSACLKLKSPLQRR